MELTSPLSLVGRCLAGVGDFSEDKVEIFEQGNGLSGKEGENRPVLDPAEAPWPTAIKPDALGARQGLGGVPRSSRRLGVGRCYVATQS